ncbi:MAG: nucleotide sugar dehydrogenase [Clostridiaceae bacterium]|nr:nucleotide sugar dehydrogenase [Clostridiaceae bacterium]
MALFEDIINRKENISVIGLGYVGLPLAVEFAKKVNVIGFDIDKEKIETYKKGIDPTGEVGEEIKKTSIYFTSNEGDLKKAKFHIVAVPTPINKDRTPNLKPIISASEIVGRNLVPGSIVVYESTVYPGLTEEVCIPLLEKSSGLKCGVDFKVGYSPERINPGDKVHTVTKITKVVAGMDEECLEEVAVVYGLIVEAGIYKAESIKVAEAAKVIENTQRDINIAFVNELSIIFNKMGIDTKAVLKAAGTKWNFLNFTPGLVGGHCIGVDPYYLTYKAEELGYHPEVILAGRRINDNMGEYVAENTIKMLVKADRQVKGSRVLVMGFTFKENVPDTRNSKVIDIVRELQEYGVEVHVTDPIADREVTEKEYGIIIEEFGDINDIDAIILAVSHNDYKSLDLEKLKGKYRNGSYVLVDVKGIFDCEVAQNLGFLYWCL